jgi:hypothetical protein
MGTSGFDRSRENLYLCFGFAAELLCKFADLLQMFVFMLLLGVIVNIRR